MRGACGATSPRIAVNYWKKHEGPIRVKRLPHHNVYVRIRPSRIHGVGVFAIRKIKKGTPIFPDDEQPIKWIKSEDIQKLPSEVRRLYDDFCIIKDSRKTYGCPSSFNQLTASWYLNEPWRNQKPNVVCRENY